MARKEVKIPVESIERLLNAQRSAMEAGFFTAPESWELLIAISELIFHSDKDIVKGKEGIKFKLKYPKNVINFQGLFQYQDDLTAIVSWLKKNKYINDKGEWIAPIDNFSWMLQYIFDEGYTRLVPPAKARQKMALLSFNISIKIDRINRIEAAHQDSILPERKSKSAVNRIK